MFAPTESDDFDSSALKKLKASFVPPSLASKAHFANSMSGFGKVVRKKKANSLNHSPEESKIEANDSLTKTFSEDDSLMSEPACDAAVPRIGESGTEGPSSSNSPEKDPADDLPNPFKSIDSIDSIDGAVTDVGDDPAADGENSDEEAPTDLIGLAKDPANSTGNSLSLLSGLYDESSSGDSDS